MFWLGLLVGAVLVVGVWAHLGKGAELDFWSLYAKGTALAGAGSLGWLGYRAGNTAGAWWSSPAGAALVAVVVGAVAPLTAFVVSWAKITLDAQRQSHEIKHAEVKQNHEIANAKAQQSHDIAQAKARQEHDIAESKAKQEHGITSDYLAKALDIELPLATRYQLLRFLATPHQDKARLQTWAAAELKRIDPAFERLTQDQRAVREEMAAAKTAEQVAAAEAKLRALNARSESASGKPPAPGLSIEALKAGIFVYKELGPLALPKADLDGVDLQGASFGGSNFSGATMRSANLYDVDAPQCNFNGADLKGARLQGADVRGGSFVGADLQGAALEKTRLDGADLTDASLEEKNVKAIYDRHTKWPKGFDPKKAGCVAVAPE